MQSAQTEDVWREGADELPLVLAHHFQTVDRQVLVRVHSNKDAPLQSDCVSAS